MTKRKRSFFEKEKRIMGMRLWTHDLYFDKFEIFQPNPLCVFFNQLTRELLLIDK